MKLFLYDSECSSINDIEKSLQDSGSFSAINSIAFEQGDQFIIFEYDINVDGYIEVDDGDYWTPPYSEIIISNFDIEIKRVYYIDVYNNGIDLELDNDSINNTISMIKNYYPI